MGRYHDPGTLPQHGRKLADQTPNFALLAAQLQPEEELVALYQRLDMPWKNAPYVPDATELEEFERQHREGRIRREGFFAARRAGKT